MAANVVVLRDGWDRLMRRLQLDSSAVRDSSVLVGILADAGGDEPHGDGDLTMIELAAIHEFGSPAAGIPSRSFIRSTFAAKREELIKITKIAAEKFVAGASLERVLGMIGAWAANAIKATIRAGVEPPLKQATIDRKGSSKPLVDTGRMINAITWLVKIAGGGE